MSSYMANYDQAWAVGGIFLLVAVLLIVSLMKESIPYAVRRGAQVLAFLGVVGFAAFAAVQKSGVSWSWPTLNTPTITHAEAPKVEMPAPKAKSPKKAAPEWHTSPNLNRRLKVGTMREVTPEEAQRLMAH
jgi:hypothetical protein